jgi:hypothetical protein
MHLRTKLVDRESRTLCYRNLLVCCLGNSATTRSPQVTYAVRVSAIESNAAHTDVTSVHTLKSQQGNIATSTIDCVQIVVAFCEAHTIDELADTDSSAAAQV